ncbi:MAG TPA: hypothetical protein VNA13_01600 [Xanthomonadales bacterium]|nr:hypothetical protein [Xanthomonadales bacterium]
MANQEKKLGEGTMEAVRNVGVVIGVLGIIAALAGMRIGGDLFVKGAAVGAAGEVGRRVVGSGKK